jgi:hypothetical protein
MREKVCAGLALAASYWRVPAAALGPQPEALDAPAVELRDRCENPDVRSPRRRPR